MRRRSGPIITKGRQRGISCFVASAEEARRIEKRKRTKCFLGLLKKAECPRCRSECHPSGCIKYVSSYRASAAATTAIHCCNGISHKKRTGLECVKFSVLYRLSSLCSLLQQSQARHHLSERKTISKNWSEFSVTSNATRDIHPCILHPFTHSLTHSKPTNVAERNPGGGIPFVTCVAV